MTLSDLAVVTTATPLRHDCDSLRPPSRRREVAQESLGGRITVASQLLHDSISVANLTGLTFLYKLLSLQLNNVVYKSCDSCPIFMYIFFLVVGLCSSCSTNSTQSVTVRFVVLRSHRRNHIITVSEL